jgi:hypothetical protein
MPADNTWGGAQQLWWSESESEGPTFIWEKTVPYHSKEREGGSKGWSPLRVLEIREDQAKCSNKAYG